MAKTKQATAITDHECFHEDNQIRISADLDSQTVTINIFNPNIDASVAASECPYAYIREVRSKLDAAIKAIEPFVD